MNQYFRKQPWFSDENAIGWHKMRLTTSSTMICCKIWCFCAISISTSLANKEEMEKKKIRRRSGWRAGWAFWKNIVHRQVFPQKTQLGNPELQSHSSNDLKKYSLGGNLEHCLFIIIRMFGSCILEDTLCIIFRASTIETDLISLKSRLKAVARSSLHVSFPTLLYISLCPSSHLLVM